LKSALVFIPLAFYDLQKEINRKLITSYCILVLLASLYCLLFAARDYSQTLDESLFFYHRLARQLSHHAVYFSVFVFIALVLLLENFRSNSIVLNKLFSVSAIVFLSIFLFLLSSKLVIAFYLLYLLYYFVVLLKKNKTKRVLIILLFTCILVAGGTAVIIRNPVSNRFYEIIYSDMRLVNQDKFDPADYFDGLQFRILQWKFVPEILNRTQSWWFGVSPGGAQALLDQEYTSKHMYTGDGQHSRGLLGYNTHNQFLQALLQTGLIGLMAFLFIFICLAGMAWQIRRTGYVFIILLLLAWLFSESAFETQYGILIFTFFPIFFTHTEMELFPARKKVPDFPEKQALPHFIKSEST
jgi:O-antigen ligase